jgi:hypothetical protein
MHLKNFEPEISETILQRGKSYYKNGAVTDLQVLDNGQCFAIVEGNDDYEVNIRLGKDGEVRELLCNCPYDGGICKHIVAVLYKLREENPVSGMLKTAKESRPWENIVSIVPEDELRKFLKGYAAKNQNLRNDLMIKFAGYDTMDNRDKYKHILNGIFTSAGDRHGFIDYQRTSGAMQQVFELLAKADEYIEEGNYYEAFGIAAAVAPGCIDALQNMDDSNGECCGAIDNAFEITSKILLSGANSSLKNEMFNWLLREAANPDYGDYGCADELYPLLVAAVDSPERAKSVLAFLDDQLKKASLKEGWSREYGTKNLLGLKIDVLIKTGRDVEAANIISSNMKIHDFRKIMVEKHLAEHNFDEAIRLIKEGISIAVMEKYPGVVINWKEMLMDIYKRQNNLPELRTTVKDLYYSGRFEMKYYLEYKSTFGKEEWKAELEKIVNSHKKNEKGGQYQFKSMSYDLDAIYVEEEMWGDLFEMLQKEPNIYALLKYSRYLVKEYASELIPLYKNAINFAAQKASDRKGYHEVASYILKMAELPGGKESALNLKNEFIVKFNKRPALKDELNKLKI